MLCFKCDEITLSYDPNDDMRQAAFREYPGFADLISTVHLGCSFCSLVWRVTLDQKQQAHPRDQKTVFDLDKSSENWTRVICSLSGSNDTLRISYQTRQIVKNYHLSGDLDGIYALPDNPSSQWIAGRPIYQHPNARSVYDLAASWLQHCRYNHPECGSDILAPLPTRVIDVGPHDGSQTPFLHVPAASEMGEYAALSYCWGKVDTNYILTQATLHHKQRGIPIKTLPQTLQDAITITRGLHIRYLWIDALCIIQDSRSDWEVEAAKMGKVYTRAQLTIGASAASDCTQGILIPREIGESEVPELNTRGPNSSLGKARLRYLTPNAISIPLFTRGWTLQESLLSTRFLSYTSRQLTWECQTSAYSEGNMFFDGNDFASPTRNPLFRPLQTKETDERQGADFPWKHDPYAHWIGLVDNYTSRNLTYVSDKLPALSGLASNVQTALPEDRYLAGLWRSHLPHALAWFCRGKDGRGRKPPEAGNSAPSWSWASVVGEVTFGVLETSEPALAEVLDSETTPDGLNPFGSVTRGSLRLRTVMARAGQLIETNDTTDYHVYGTKFRLYVDHKYQGLLGPTRPPHSHVLGSCRFDDYDQMSSIFLSDVEIFCVGVTRDQGLLAITDGRDSDCAICKRIGWYRFKANIELDWFRDCDITTIIIR